VGGGGGVFISTDGGQTWNSGQGVAASDSVTDMAIDSTGNVYAAMAATYSLHPSDGIYECANPCAAPSTWTLLGGGVSGSDGFPAGGSDFNIKLSVVQTTAGGGGAAVYAVSANGGDSTHILGIYRLLPGSATWTQIATKTVAASYEDQAWYDLYVWADPADPSGGTVYLGLSDIYKTTTGTAASPTWSNLTSVYNGGMTGVHPDQHVATSNGGSTIFFGNEFHRPERQPRDSAVLPRWNGHRRRGGMPLEL
jgi:hypothetical protein